MGDVPIADVLPAFVTTVSCRVDACHARLAPAEAGLVVRAVEKRRAEFTAGRFCAHQALARCSCDIAAIGADAYGAPLWPDAMVGSITHSRAHAAAAVACAADCRGIGIDIEALGRFTRTMANRVLLPEEIEGLGCSFGSDWLCGATMLFSAKESVYKCLYPLVGPAMRFHDAQITVAGTHALEIILSPALHERLPHAFSMQGYWCLEQQEVVTAIVLQLT